MKPLLGFLADSVVIGGYSKRYWIILVTLPSIVACAVFGVFGAEVLGPDAIAALVFVMALQFAMIDLLSEAEYARKLQQNAEHGPGLMSFVWAGVFVSSLLSTTISGAMLEWAAAKWAVLAALPFIATPIVPAVLNWLGEARHFEKRAEGGRDGNVDATRVLLLGGSEGAGDAATTGVAAMGERDAEGESTEKDESEDEEEDAVHRTAAAEGTRVVAASFDILLPPASPAGAPSSASGSAAGSRGRCAACCDCFRRNVCAVDCAKARSQRKLFTLSLGMGVLAIVTTAMQTFGNDVSIANVLPCDGEADAEAGPSIACRCGDEIGQIVESVIVGALVLVGFWAFTPPPVAKVQTFFFVQNVFTISIEGGAFYFFTDDATAFPDGPHFSNAFYVTAIGVVSNLFALVGIWSYNSLMHNWKYRTILLVANLAFMLVNVVSAAVYLRWNRIVGIPDDAFVIGRSVLLLPLFFISFVCPILLFTIFCFTISLPSTFRDDAFVIGSDAFVEVTYLWTYMPSVVIMSQLCPHGVEATMYALLAGSSNFGQQLASSAGSFSLCMLGVQPTGAAGESAQFDNLWIAALISALLPCVPLLLLPVLIPDARQTDVLLGGEASAAGRGAHEGEKRRAFTWAAPHRGGGMSFSFSEVRANKRRGASAGGAAASSAAQSYGALPDGDDDA
jgi:hypothetical protein